MALKGGCNLRFLFGSVRSSEDMDLDVVVLAKETLKNKVGRHAELYAERSSWAAMQEDVLARQEALR